MKQAKRESALKLTRRHWLVLAASAMSVSCGPPGTGGTGATGPEIGIYTQGPISGFGSVIVNGIHFDDTTATVQIDGKPASSADLRLGMVATIQGQSGATNTQGTASSIVVWTITQGPIISGSAAPGTSGQFTVAGITLLTDSSTVFSGIGAAVPAVPGQWVAVWGLQSSPDALTWRATRVQALPPPLMGTGTTTDTPAVMVSSGLVADQGANASIGGVTLNSTGISTQSQGLLQQGELVRVAGTLSSTDNSFLVQDVQSLNPSAAMGLQSLVQMEGIVVSMLTGNRFQLGNIPVDANQASVVPQATQITVGSRVVVKGSSQSGVLMAATIILLDAQTPALVPISGVIERYTSLADFVLHGQRCDASAATILPGAASDLRVGVSVNLSGILEGDVLRVTTLGVAI